MKFIFLLLPLSLMANNIAPWGKDSGLAYLPKEIVPYKEKRFLGDSLIKFHQDVISPADGPRSNFVPTSSHYTLQAMQKYGFFRGFFMGCDRLMRENKDPWVYRKTFDKKGNLMKWDPA